jgi:hypothetical protein
VKRQQELIVWAALLSGVVMLGIVGFAVGPQMRAGRTQPFPEAVSFIAVALGVTGPVAGHVLRRALAQIPRGSS